MCGRYVLDKDIDVIEKRFGAHTLGQHEFRPRYNIAPSQAVPVVTHERTLMFLPWGFAPAWSKRQVINARVEGLGDRKPYFRTAQHCLVPASGFYEWKRVGARKVPYYIHTSDGRLVAFAGLMNENGFCIVTTAAAGAVAEIHDRMPLILTLETEPLWLEGSPISVEPPTLLAYPVSTAVSSSANDGPELLLP